MARSACTSPYLHLLQCSISLRSADEFTTGYSVLYMYCVVFMYTTLDMYMYPCVYWYAVFNHGQKLLFLVVAQGRKYRYGVKRGRCFLQFEPLGSGTICALAGSQYNGGVQTQLHVYVLAGHRTQKERADDQPTTDYFSWLLVWYTPAPRRRWIGLFSWMSCQAIATLYLSLIVEGVSPVWGTTNFT